MKKDDDLKIDVLYWKVAIKYIHKSLASFISYNNKKKRLTERKPILKEQFFQDKLICTEK